jgi:hypothetical protein
MRRLTRIRVDAYDFIDLGRYHPYRENDGCMVFGKRRFFRTGTTMAEREMQ